jgi:16S rRNA (uracil1498-N3)-methyltransferase
MKHLFRLLGSFNDNDWGFSSGELHHAYKVLRLDAGARLEVSDGEGRVDQCEIVSIDKNHLQLKVLSSKLHPSRGLPTTLLCPALDHGLLEESLPGFVEAGVDAVWVYLPEGTDKKRMGPKKMERWQQKVAVAVKQSKRAHQPELKSFPDLAAALKELGPACEVYFGCQNGRSPQFFVQPVSRQESQPQRLAFVCGAEKGLSSAELEALGNHGGQGVCLSPYVLRAKTAALIGLPFLEQVRTARLP